MIAALLFGLFTILLIIGVPVAIALGASGMVAIIINNWDTQWFGLMSVPQSFYAGLSKYPLLAIPMFVLLGTIFERSGVALRIVNFATALIGRGPGMLPMISIVVAMFMGGISGSGPASAAAIGGVMISAMTRAGYIPAFSASVVAAGAERIFLSLRLLLSLSTQSLFLKLPSLIYLSLALSPAYLLVFA